MLVRIREASGPLLRASDSVLDLVERQVRGDRTLRYQTHLCGSEHGASEAQQAWTRATQPCATRSYSKVTRRLRCALWKAAARRADSSMTSTALVNVWMRGWESMNLTPAMNGGGALGRSRTSTHLVRRGRPVVAYRRSVKEQWARRSRRVDQALRSRNALKTTLTDDRLMAKAAIIGERRSPNAG